MAGRAWRWRRCPRCGAVEPASAFEVVGSFRPGWEEQGTVDRRCPACRTVARSFEFPVVRERREQASRAR